MNTKIIELSQRFAKCKADYDVTETALKDISTKWTEAEAELISAMVDEGVNSIEIDGVGIFSIRTKNYLSVNAANKERFFEYLYESGNEHLLKMDVNPRTLTSFLTEHLDSLIKANLKDYDGDSIECRNKMLEFLNEKGANYFTKRDIAMKAK